MPAAEPQRSQDFLVPRGAHQVMDAAEVYLDGAGLVSTGLAGSMERQGDQIVVYHGRMTTRIEVQPDGAASQVRVRRSGQAPLAASRRILYVLGILSALLGWLLAYYNNRLSPLLTAAVFFVAIVATVVVLYVVDRSLEKRSQSLMMSLEDAVRGDPWLVLRREVQALERTSSIVNALLFYCAGLVVEFLVFTLLLQNGIDDAVTIAVMQPGFLYPAVPAALFGLAYWAASRRLHADRFRLVEERIGRTRPAARPRRQ